MDAKCSRVREIFFTLQSLDAPERVGEFKFRMSFAAEPVRQRVVFHPALARYAGTRTHGLVVRLLARHPDDPVLAKAEGMLRFHIQGNRPLEAQERPACLAEARAKFIAGSSDGVEIEPRLVTPASVAPWTRGNIQQEVA